MPASSAPVAPGAQQTKPNTADPCASHPLSIEALHERYREGATPVRGALPGPFCAALLRVEEGGASHA